MIKEFKNLLVFLVVAGYMITQTPILKANTLNPPQEQTSKPRAAAKDPVSKKSSELTIGQVIQLVEAKLPDAVILSTIRKQEKPVAHTPEDLITLRKAGASDAILLALMGSTASSSKPSESSAAPEPPDQLKADEERVPAFSETSLPAQSTLVRSIAPGSSAPAEVSGVVAKKRVIVDEFEYGTVRNAVQAMFGTDQDVGKGIRSRLITRLSSSGKVTIVERAKLNEILREQDFGASGRVQKSTGAALGKIKGADAILTGNIVVFGRDDRSERKGAAGGGVGAFFGGLMKWKKNSKAVVAIDYRLVDAETSEVIDTGEARGESKRESGGWAGLLVIAGAGGAAAKDVQSSNFDETIIGEATVDCVNNLADIIIQKAANLPVKKIEIESRVADVNGSTLVIAAGSSDGVQVGDRFKVGRIVREVRDPVTREILDVITEDVGELVVTTVREKISTGTFTGTTAAKVNDVVRTIR